MEAKWVIKILNKMSGEEKNIASFQTDSQNRY
jgi:hypothetical protein